MAEFETFIKEWETAERSRHARLMEQLKREYRESPRASVPAETAIAAPYSLRLSQSVLRQQVKPQNQSPRSRRADISDRAQPERD